MPYKIKFLLCQLPLILLVACGSPQSNDAQNPGARGQGGGADANADGGSGLVEVKGPKSAEEADLLILALGDSLYAGYGLQRGEGFPEELQNALADAGLNAFVFNAGVSGDTSAAGRARLDYALEGLPRKPDMVILGLGGNDMLRAIEPSETRNNMEAMVKSLSDKDIPVMLTGMLASPNMGPDYSAQFNPIFPSLAKKYDAALYPFFMQEVVGNKALFLDDGIHPTAEGIDKITAAIAPMVIEKLSENKENQ